MKKTFIAVFACLAFASVAPAFDDDYDDDFDDDEDVRVYVTPRYRTIEPVIVRREVIHQPVIYTDEIEPVRFVTPQEVRTRVFLRRTHRTAPNHR